MGTYDLSKGGKFYKVSRVAAHENYDMPKLANDIAVVELQKKLKFNDKVQPIKLETKDIPDGAQVYLTGWGFLNVSSNFV